ncbi:MAG: phosphatase PAP2 family protein [Nitrospiraceae bacterium]|nr:phosphatase PAP2 family protein [Nitrospiraceae bacterium]
MTFYGLLDFDLPITRYVRSVTVHLPWDQLTIPWMAFTSNAGDWIGEGSHLVALSLVLLATGWWLSKPSITTAGIQTLWAHGIAALAANIVKHLLGRPRPKFVHSGEWQFAPSWASGLDSFPSGHTTASFAVATVLAKRFPWCAALGFALAAFVGLSRVLRGSHFPTDVCGGAVMGLLSGSVASAAWKEWRASLEEGLRHAAIGMAAAFSLLWTFAHNADAGMTGTLLIALGIAAMATGLWLRRVRWSHGVWPAGATHEKLSRGLLAYGLAAMTTAPLVVASVGFACLAYWSQSGSDHTTQRSPSRTPAMLAEGALVGSVVLALTVLYSGRGVLPFR